MDIPGIDIYSGVWNMDDWITILRLKVIMSVDGTTNMSRLARNADITNSAFGKNVDWFIKKGIVEAKFIGRERILKLTEKGERVRGLVSSLSKELKYKIH